MRVVKEIPHASCRISIFSWNGKYLIKLEQGMIEQTYKIDEFDLTGESDLDEVLNENFINKAVQRFSDMNKDLATAMKDI